jgi:glutaredoxin
LTLGKKRPATPPSGELLSCLLDYRRNLTAGVLSFTVSLAIYNSNMHDVVVYSRKECHLCDVVKQTLMKLQKDADFRWREIDIDADDELRRIYTDEVPVVFIDGRKAFKYRMGEHEFLHVLKGRE